MFSESQIRHLVMRDCGAFKPPGNLTLYIWFVGKRDTRNYAFLLALQCRKIRKNQGRGKTGYVEQTRKPKLCQRYDQFGDQVVFCEFLGGRGESNNKQKNISEFVRKYLRLFLTIDKCPKASLTQIYFPPPQNPTNFIGKICPRICWHMWEFTHKMFQNL